MLYKELATITIDTDDILTTEIPSGDLDRVNWDSFERIRGIVALKHEHPLDMTQEEHTNECKDLLMKVIERAASEKWGVTDFEDWFTWSPYMYTIRQTIDEAVETYIRKTAMEIVENELLEEVSHA